MLILDKSAWSTEFLSLNYSSFLEIEHFLDDSNLCSLNLTQIKGKGTILLHIFQNDSSYYFKEKILGPRICDNSQLNQLNSFLIYSYYLYIQFYANNSLHYLLKSTMY